MQLDNPISMHTYPMLSMVIVVVLLFLSPFFSSLPSYAAFAVCLYRAIRYDAKVFAADYCILAPMAQVFCASKGMSLLLYLVLLVGVWHVLRNGIRSNKSYVMLIVVMNYLVLRMQLSITNFLLCFGHLCMLCVILTKQDAKSATFAAKAYCTGLLISSAYALLFRNTWQLRRILGVEAEAIWGSGIMRFRGLIADPNYYMTMLVMGLVVLAKLRDCRHIGAPTFLVVAACYVVLGLMTYSKTFIVMLALLVLIYILWQFYNNKHIRGLIISLAILACIPWLLFAEESPFAVVLARFGSGSDLSDMTTGRTDVYAAYLKEIFSGWEVFSFGVGMADEGLVRDPHNIFIELVYYLGILGFAAYIAFFAAMVGTMKDIDLRVRKENMIAQNVSIIMVVVLFFTLHGIFQPVFYANAFIALLAILIIPKEAEENAKQ